MKIGIRIPISKLYVYVVSYPVFFRLIWHFLVSLKIPHKHCFKGLLIIWLSPNFFNHFPTGNHLICLLFLAIGISFTSNIIVHISDHFFRDGCTFLDTAKLLSKKLTYSWRASITQPQLQALPPHMTTFHSGWKPASFTCYGSSWKAPQDWISTVSQGC